MRALVALLLVPLVAAQPQWEGWTHDWSVEDAVDDPEKAPLMAPGADVHVLSASVVDGVLYWHMAIVPADGAAGDYFYQVFWHIGETRYATAADITWVGGEPVRVEASNRGGGRIGDVSWDAATHALVFAVDGDRMGAPAPGTPVRPAYAIVGQTLGPSGEAGFWDYVQPDSDFTFGTAPAPAPRSTTTEPAQDAPLPLLVPLALVVAYTLRTKSRISATTACGASSCR